MNPIYWAWRLHEEHRKQRHFHTRNLTAAPDDLRKLRTVIRRHLGRTT
jgi:hypothetical protein